MDEVKTGSSRNLALRFRDADLHRTDFMPLQCSVTPLVTHVALLREVLETVASEREKFPIPHASQDSE